MKKIYFAFRLTLVVLFAAMATSCSHSDLDYLNAVPSDAMAVFTFNPSDLAAKADLKTLLDAKMPEIEASLPQGEDAAFFKSLITDPMSAGIDLKRPIAVYLSDLRNMDAGCVAAVASSSKLKAFFDALQKEGDCTVDGAKIVFTGGVLYGEYNKRALVLARSAESAHRQLKQSERKSLMDDPSFVKFCSQKGDLNFWLNPSQMSGQTLAMYKKMYDKLDMKSMRVVCHVDFEKGKIATRESVVFNDGKAAKSFEGFAANYYGTIEGRLLSFVPADALCVLAINMKDGAKIYEMLNSVKEIAEVITEWNRATGVNVKELLTSVKGDIVLAASPSPDGKMIPQVSIMIQTTDNKLAAALADQAAQQGMEPVRKGTDSYMLPLPGTELPVMWGYANGVTYVTDAAAMPENIRATRPLADNFASTPAAANFSKSNSAMTFDMQAINRIYAPVLNSMMNEDNQLPIALALSVMASVDRISACNEGQFNGVMDITLLNDKENALRQIVHGLAK